MDIAKQIYTTYLDLNCHSRLDHYPVKENNIPLVSMSYKTGLVELCQQHCYLPCNHGRVYKKYTLQNAKELKTVFSQSSIEVYINRVKLHSDSIESSIYSKI